MAADPVVSPADTLRRAEQTLRAALPCLPTLEALFDAEAALDALLAVGERDKAEIEALTAAVEGLLDVGKRSRSGDPSLDPEEWYAIRDYAEKVLKDGGGAVLREARERDRRHIAQLTDALETLLRFARPVDIEAALVQAGVDVRAVLAVEEDAE